MTSQEEMLRAVLENPLDATLRMVWADALEEIGVGGDVLHLLRKNGHWSVGGIFNCPFGYTPVIWHADGDARILGYPVPDAWAPKCHCGDPSPSIYPDKGWLCNDCQRKEAEKEIKRLRKKWRRFTYLNPV